MEKITIKDIAREAGVSVGLVSMTLNGKTGVNPKTAEAIMNVVKKLNYTPNKTASALRSGYKKTIGVITPDLSNHYFSVISRNIENIAYNNGYTVLFGSSDDRIDKIGKLIDTFRADGISGILISACDGCENEIRKAMSCGIKVVLMNREINIEGAGKVMLDNEKAIRMGIDHLLKKGFKHIEMFSNGISLSTLKIREQSYLSRMSELGLGDVARVVYVDEKKPEELDKALKDSIGRGTDAIFIPRGYLALHICSSAKRLGLHIPEDLGIVGFDGGDTYRMVTPSITQLIQDTRATAEDSFSMLTDMIQNNLPAQDIYLEPSLEPGDSTLR